MNKAVLIISIIFFNVYSLFAQKESGIVTGIIFENGNQKPLEFATVVIKKSKDSTIIQGTLTDKNGKFRVENIPYGEYNVYYSFIGYQMQKTPSFKLDSQNKTFNLGSLNISSSDQQLDEVVVTGEKSTFSNSIDRKVFNVGKDLAGKTGSVSDLLQNVPSLTVDIDGVLSLRGSENVMVLINGRASALMGANRAAVLQQVPASSIEKIEIITNPSAKYKPDGTSGIINIVLKKNKGLGMNGAVTLNAGNDDRYNGNIIVNYNPGKFNIFGSYGFRQDYRSRFNHDSRTRADSVNTKSYSSMNSNDHSRPFTNIVNTGIDYKFNDHNEAGVAGNYNYRSFVRQETDINNSLNSNLELTKDYDRIRRDPEFEKDMEITGNFKHKFSKEDHELNLDFNASKSDEQEDNHYSNIFRIPAIASTYDNTLIRQGGNESQVSLEYTNPLAENIKLESGYILEYRKEDMNFYGESLNPKTDLWEKDTTKSNRFIFDETIHVLYSTYEQEIDKFGYLVGIRAEQAFVNSDQLTTKTKINNQYFKLYPSLHLSYKLTDEHELQVNYSHRINRPEGDELNPFPEYQDPYNLRIGNPKLKPEDIHSIEMGYHFKKNNTTFISTLYYRYIYNGMTDITRYISDTVLLSTRQNLAKSTSAGMELVLSTRIGEFVNINLSDNTFYNTIDASSIGYSRNKSIISWSANLGAGFNISKSSVLQITSNYVAERLTPQGKRLPSFVMNMGFKQEVLKKKASLILTVSDVFNSLRNNSILDTPELYQKVIRKRSARIIYIGFSYTFGNQNKKQKENSLKFDNQL